MTAGDGGGPRALRQSFVFVFMFKCDAVFMPVTRVNFTIDETAVAEGGSARERLRMEIVTDGSITPDDALAQSANQLIELFQPLAKTFGYAAFGLMVLGTGNIMTIGAAYYFYRNYYKKPEAAPAGGAPAAAAVKS